MSLGSLPTFIIILGYFLVTAKSVAPCKNTSQECLRSAIQTAIPGFISGIPEMGIEPLDPFVINKLELMLPGGLVMEFRQGISKGLRKCTVDFARYVNSNFNSFIFISSNFLMLFWNIRWHIWNFCWRESQCS